MNMTQNIRKLDVSRLLVVFIIGWLALFFEAYLVGLHAKYFVHSTAFNSDVGSLSFYLREIGFTAILWIPSLIVATYCISLIRPRRWFIYSLVAVSPAIVTDMLGFWPDLTAGVVTFSHHGAYVFAFFLHILLLPLLLALMYLAMGKQ
jgi:hypothetical protein